MSIRSWRHYRSGAGTLTSGEGNNAFDGIPSAKMRTKRKIGTAVRSERGEGKCWIALMRERTERTPCLGMRRMFASLFACACFLANEPPRVKEGAQARMDASMESRELPVSMTHNGLARLSRASSPTIVQCMHGDSFHGGSWPYSRRLRGLPSTNVLSY